MRLQPAIAVLTISAATLILLIVIPEIVSFTPKQDSDIRDPSITNWMDRIRKNGGNAAYSELIARYEGKSRIEQHLQAHIFGEALYRQSGITAMGVCDDSFFSGCFHQFIGLALAEHGSGIIADLHAACERSTSVPDVCTHALGHGIIASFGYSEQDLRSALDFCVNVPNFNPYDPVHECGWGGFMEFNMRVLLGEDRQIRELGAESVYYPCDSRDSKWRQTCYRAQPSWWESLFSETYPEKRSRVAHMGFLCSQIAAAAEKAACFEGIGLMIAWNYNVSGEVKRTFCEDASAEKDQQLSCKFFLAYWNWALWRREGLEKKYADPVCVGLSGEEFDTCKMYAKGRPPK